MERPLAAAFCPLCQRTFDDPGVVFCTRDGARLRSGGEITGYHSGRLLGDRYRVARFLGAGGMADVYEADDLRTGRRVALKVVNPKISSSPAIIDRFKQEAQIISLIAHPNVVALEDFGALADGTYYIAMELLQGRSLASAIDADEVDPRLALDVAMEACEGLQAAHDKNIIHRDIKPDNIFLHSPGGSGALQVKILDLGIAKLYGPEAVSNLTQTGAVFGTAEYMSPEQALGHVVTPASDVYSLGVVLYEMFLGRPPFSSSSFMAILTRHLTEPPMWQQDLAKQRGVPPEAEALVMKALSKNQDQRFATMRKLYDALAELRAHAQSVRVRGSEHVTRNTARPPVPAVVNLSASCGGTDREVVEIAEDIYWVGRRQGMRLECNSYLRVYKGNGLQLALLVDPGPPKDLATIAAKISAGLGSLDRIDLLFLNHQDPDVVANASALQAVNPRLHVLCSEDTWRLIQFYGLNPKAYSSVERFPELRTRLATGHVVSFVPTPYCHFRGAVMLYDHAEQVLFSGDLFGGLTRSASLVATTDAWPGIEAFHQLYMPSSKALKLATARIRSLAPPPRFILPQHGGLIPNELIPIVLRGMDGLRVGVDLMGDPATREAQVQEVNLALEALKWHLGGEGLRAILARFSSDGSFPNLFRLDESDHIGDIKIEPRAALRALEREVYQATPESKHLAVQQVFQGALSRIRTSGADSERRADPHEIALELEGAAEWR